MTYFVMKQYFSVFTIHFLLGIISQLTCYGKLHCSLQWQFTKIWFVTDVFFSSKKKLYIYIIIFSPKIGKCWKQKFTVEIQLI